MSFYPPQLSYASSEQSRVEVYQTPSQECSNEEICNEPDPLPECKLTLTYSQNKLKRIDLYGYGKNDQDLEGYFYISNNKDVNPELKVRRDRTTAQEDRVQSTLVLAGLRFDVYREITSFRITGLSKGQVNKVSGYFRVKIAGFRAGWIRVNCQNLTRLG